MTEPKPGLGASAGRPEETAAPGPRSPAPRMIDVSEKAPTIRTARAEGFLRLGPRTLETIGEGITVKGNVYDVSRLAGVMGTKLTPRLIPLCHPISLTSAEVTVRPQGADCVRFESWVVAYDRTGVEMEALTAVTAAALAFYDMIKSIDRGARIERVRLLEKSGGRSGHFVAPEPEGTEASD